MSVRHSAILLLAGACLAQDVAPNVETRMDQIVQSYATDKKFMGTALAARSGEVLFSKAYGSANLEWNIPNTPSTKFRLGSVTKQFTAVSILMLAERGKVKIEDPVKNYMPDAPAKWNQITIFHLLTHTSGIPNLTALPEYPKLEPFATKPAELVALFRDKPLEFDPGAKWNYSNSGYLLLGYLIEKISGQTYDQFVRENIFTPLGMKDSGYDSNSAIIAHRAAGYTPGPNGPQNAGFIHMSIPHGAGALYSTTEDLLKWEQGLFGGKLINATSLAKMITPFKSDYAFGVGVRMVHGHKVIDHGGGIEGFNTHLAYYPDDKLTVVVLANLNGTAPGEIAEKLAAVAHGESVKLASERKEITLSKDILNRYIGAYKMAIGPANLIGLEGEHLTTKLGNGPSLPLYPESETVFWLKNVDAQVEFPPTPQGARASGLTVHQGGGEMTGTRLDDAEAKKLAEAAAANAKHFKDQTPAPGSEVALRKTIEDIRAGKPDFLTMSETLADATRRQLPQLQASLQHLGKVQSVTFKGVGPAGPDIYDVKFENGSLRYRIWMSAEGKVESMNQRPL